MPTRLTLSVVMSVICGCSSSAQMVFEVVAGACDCDATRYQLLLARQEPRRCLLRSSMSGPGQQLWSGIKVSQDSAYDVVVLAQCGNSCVRCEASERFRPIDGVTLRLQLDPRSDCRASDPSLLQLASCEGSPADAGLFRDVWVDAASTDAVSDGASSEDATAFEPRVYRSLTTIDVPEGATKVWIRAWGGGGGAGGGDYDLRTEQGGEGGGGGYSERTVAVQAGQRLEMLVGFGAEGGGQCGGHAGDGGFPGGNGAVNDRGERGEGPVSGGEGGQSTFAWGGAGGYGGGGAGGMLSGQGSGGGGGGATVVGRPPDEALVIAGGGGGGAAPTGIHAGARGGAGCGGDGEDAGSIGAGGGGGGACAGDTTERGENRLPGRPSSEFGQPIPGIGGLPGDGKDCSRMRGADGAVVLQFLE